MQDVYKRQVYAPGSGEITIFFETGHAIGMKLDNGAEVLIHVGIDTVLSLIHI